MIMNKDMKKIFRTMLATAVAAIALSGCSDVPAPYTIPSVKKTVEVTPTGDGTLASPFNSAKANEVASALANGETSAQSYYIKGKVVSIRENYTTQYGTATFYISDDGTANGQFYVYRALYLGNKKYTAGEQLKVGDEVIIYGKLTNYKGTAETVQNGAYLYSLNGVSEGGPDERDGEATGNGTLESPYNCIAAIKAASTLAADAQSDVVYVKGKVSSVKEAFSTQYGNASFYISDDGTANGEFYVFRTLYLGNKKYTSGDQIKAGDEVIICGKLTNYKGNTPETVQNESYLYSLNGKTDGGSTQPDTPGIATGDGTLANPYNSVKANEVASALASGAQSDVVYVKGKIVSIKDAFSTQYGNASFYISDDGAAANQFYVFRTLYLGNVKYTAGEQPKAGDEVVICGKLTNYMGNTPETVQNESYLYSLNGKTESSGETPGENPSDGIGTLVGNVMTVTPAEFGIGNGVEVNTITLCDGTKLSFASGGNNNAPKYYNAGTNVRMYPKNSMTVTSSKTITSIKLSCDTYQGTLCNAEGAVGAEPGTVGIKDDVIDITGVNAKSTTITNNNSSSGAKSQVRCTKIEIIYAQ